jgi:hypothetical protein
LEGEKQMASLNDNLFTTLMERALLQAESEPGSDLPGLLTGR